jgi:hypothetical protein
MTPSATAAIGGLRGLATYSVPDRERHNWTAQELEELDYCKSGIHQSRNVAGTAIMLLGSAFREGGPRYVNAREAYLEGYGTRSKKPSKSARKKSKVNR